MSSEAQAPRASGRSLGRVLLLWGLGGGLLSGVAYETLFFLLPTIAEIAAHPQYYFPKEMIAINFVIFGIFGTTWGAFWSGTALLFRAVVWRLNPSLAAETFAVGLGSLIGAGCGYFFFATTSAPNPALFIVVVGIIVALVNCLLTVKLRVSQTSPVDGRSTEPVQK